MPDLRLREVRLPELHLPEMTREEIVRVIGDVRRDVDLARFDPRHPDLPESEPSKIDLSRVDIPKLIATATQASVFARAIRRPRLPFVIGGLITLGLVGFALVNSPMVRPRLAELGRRAKLRMEERRAAYLEDVAVDAEPQADVVAVPIQPAAFAESAPVEMQPVEGTDVEPLDAIRA